MLYVAFVIFLFLGTIAVVLITKSLCTLLYFLLIRLNGVKSDAEVVGYTENTYYARTTPRRLVSKYFPRFRYRVGEEDIVHEYLYVSDNRNKKNAVGDTVSVYYNRKCHGQMLVKGDCNAFFHLITFVIGIVYLYAIYIIVGKLVTPDNWMSIAGFSLGTVSSLLLLLAQTVYFLLKGYLHDRKIKKLCIINGLISVLVTAVLFLLVIV